jgi:HEAT repeat protein
MIAPSEFERYLQSILNVSREDIQREVRDRYIPTLAELPLQVQTRALSKADSQEQQKERREQFAVLEGLRKYAPEHVLLVGKPGSGKSTSLRRLLWEEAGRCLEASEQSKSEIPKIPILIELRNLSGSVLAAIQEKLEWWLDLDEKTLKALLRDRRLLLLLDGLNELPNEKAWVAVDQFKQICAELKVPLIITTRELGSGLVQGNVKKLEMLPLTEPQMREFVHKRLPETGGELWRQIQGKLRELAETPLLLKLLCDVFEQNNEEIPKNRGDLFSKEFKRRYEEFKPERLRNVSEDSRRFAFDLLSYLAFIMVQGEPHTDPYKPSASWITIPKTQAEKILATFLAGDRTPDVTDMAKAKEWLEDLLEWHLLQVASDRDRIEFHHQLFQEYYTAEWLLPKLAELSDDELKYYYLNYLKWTEVIAFMLALIDEQDFGGRGREQAVRVVKLALEADSKFPAVDLMLGARLAGEVKPQPFQEQTIELVSAAQLSDEAEVSEWLRIELLGRTGSKLALPKLRQFLKNSNLDIARKATAWIGFLGYQEAIPDLLQMLSELDRWIPQENGSRVLSDRTVSLEIEIIEAIGKLSQKDAVLKLRKFFRESSTFIYFWIQPKISNLLANIDPEFSVEESLIILDDSRDSGRISQASELLLKVGYSNVTSKLIQRLNCEQDLQIHKAIIESLGLFDTDEAVSALTNQIKSPDSSIREQAAKTLIKYERVNAIDDLIEHLDDPDWNIRWYSAVVLGKLRSDTAIPILLEGLLDEHRNIRRVAAESLGRIESDEVICPLLSSLRDPDYAVRRSAAISLAQFNRQEAIPELLKALRHYYPLDDSSANSKVPFKWDEDKVVLIERMTYEILMSLGDDEAIRFVPPSGGIHQG